MLAGLLGSGDLACKSSAATLDAGMLSTSLSVDAARDAATEAGTSIKITSLDASTVDAALAQDDETAVPMTNEELVTRSKHLVEAIAGDNAELAIDFLLSKDAYAQFYAEKDATRAWERHMKKAFARTIHKLHQRRHSEGARFVRFELGTRLVKSSVGKGKSKRQVWHSRGSKIYFTLDGKQRHIAIREMIAWRGAWYIARLH